MHHKQKLTLVALARFEFAAGAPTNVASPGKLLSSDKVAYGR